MRSLFALAAPALRDPLSAFQVDKEVKDIKKSLSQFNLFIGKGSPEGMIKAKLGSLYLNQSGGTSTTLYVKETNDGQSTGWVAK